MLSLAETPCRPLPQRRASGPTRGPAPGSGRGLNLEALPCRFKRTLALLLEPHVCFSAFSAFFSTARFGFIYISEMPDVISFPSGQISFMSLLYFSVQINWFS